MAEESGLWVDPAEIPSAGDVERLGKALAAGRHGERDQLMANVAAYSGLRWGEIAALTMPQVDTAARIITMDRKVIEVAGHLDVEAPKNRKGGGSRTAFPDVGRRVGGQPDERFTTADTATAPRRGASSPTRPDAAQEPE